MWLTRGGDKLFFSAADLEHGRELWMSDGTETGTVLVQDFFPGVEGSDPEDLTVVGHRLFFTATDCEGCRGLWVLDLDDGAPNAPRFHRGDPNSSGRTDISDGITIFGFLFLGDPPTLSCKESADANNDGTIDISDGISLLNWLFIGGPAPAAPGPTGMPCGLDPDPAGSAGDLGCEAYASCR
jgi:ELWxxDGT repeat protein